jgi:hypothetical protein
MIRLKNHLIGRAIAISAITIIIFSVAVMSISSYTKLSVDGFSSVIPQPQPPSQNTPTADNKTIQTNLNIPVQINLTAKTPPTVNDIHIQTNMNTPIEITLTGTDSIPRDVLKFSVVNLPQHGNLTHSINPNSVLYTPDAGFSGTDSFTYKATDSQGLDNSKLATVIMTVNGSSDDSNNLVDPFGIKEIYPTKAGGEQWFMNMSDITHDPRTSFTASNPDLTRNPDGSWKVSSTEVRFNVFPSSGYHHELITTLNQQQLETKGYMQSPNDWKDV